MLPNEHKRDPHRKPFVAVRQNLQHLQADAECANALQDLLPWPRLHLSAQAHHSRPPSREIWWCMA